MSWWYDSFGLSSSSLILGFIMIVPSYFLPTILFFMPACNDIYFFLCLLFINQLNLIENMFILVQYENHRQSAAIFG